MGRLTHQEYLFGGTVPTSDCQKGEEEDHCRGSPLDADHRLLGSQTAVCLSGARG